LLPGHDVAAARGAEGDVGAAARPDEERVSNRGPVGGQVPAVDLGGIAVTIDHEERPVVRVEGGVHVRDTDVAGQDGLPAEDASGAQMADERPAVFIKKEELVADGVIGRPLKELQPLRVADPARPELVRPRQGRKRERGYANTYGPKTFHLVLPWRACWRYAF
jgi:hypothetical protein